MYGSGPIAVEERPRAPAERTERAGQAQGEQPSGGGHGERAVAARTREIHHSGDMPELSPAPWRRGSSGLAGAGGASRQRQAQREAEGDGPREMVSHESPSLRNAGGVGPRFCPP